MEVVLYIGGIYWIYSASDLLRYQTLYIFTLTGIGFVLVLIAFFAAIFMNQHSERKNHE